MPVMQAEVEKDLVEILSSKPMKDQPFIVP